MVKKKSFLSKVSPARITISSPSSQWMTRFISYAHTTGTIAAQQYLVSKYDDDIDDSHLPKISSHQTSSSSTSSSNIPEMRSRSGRRIRARFDITKMLKSSSHKNENENENHDQEHEDDTENNMEDTIEETTTTQESLQDDTTSSSTQQLKRRHLSPE